GRDGAQDGDGARNRQAHRSREGGDRQGVLRLMTEGLRPVERCQLCGSAERASLFKEEPYEVVRCRQCGLVYVTPRLSSEALVAQVYGEGYWKSGSPKTRGYADYAGDAELYLKTYRRRVGLLTPHLVGRKVRVLDVGCAAGYFLRVMREL